MRIFRMWMRTRSARKRSVLRRTFGLFLILVLASVALVLPWRWIPPPATAFILRERIASEDPVYYRWVPWPEISRNLAIAAVAAEDQKFPEHHGFDFEAIAEAVEENRNGSRVRGGSTISQQVAKNLFLWPAQSFVRKGLEAYFTVWIELLWPKQRILEVYLNVAEFGPGLYGAAAASRYAFDKTPSALTLHEAATLVAVLPSPKRMSAAHPSEYVAGRAQQIERAVRSLGGADYLASLD